MDARELEGRTASLAVLTAAVTAVADHGDALLVHGEPGIGKTACLRAVEAVARDAGHLVLSTAGTESEGNLPFAGLHRLLRPLLDLADRLPEVQSQALLTAVGMRDGGGSDPFVVSAATLNLLREASERRPLVITVDDLHWLDGPTRGVLAFVTRRLDRHRVVVVCTSPAAAELADFRDVFRDVPLARLDEPAAHRLLAGRAGDLDQARREWVVARAAGNPLALVELARTPGPVDAVHLDPLSHVLPLPPSLVRAFAGRLPQLPPAGRDAVLVAAMASDASVPEILAATAVLGGRGVSAAVLEAPQSLGLLRFDELRLSFTHPLVRTAIAQKESASRRQAAHRALGAVITVSSYRRAWHRALGTAEHDDSVAADLEAATVDRIRRGHNLATIQALERAAQLSTAPADRGRRLLFAAKHAARLGQRREVLRLLGLALDCDLSPFDRVRAELLQDDFDGGVLIDSNRVINLCRTARRAAAAGERNLALELAFTAGRRRCWEPVTARAIAQVTTLATSLAGDATDGRSVAVLALADPIGHGSRVTSLLAGVDEDDAVGADGLSDYAVAAWVVGQYRVAIRLFDRAEAELRPRGLRGVLARNLGVTASMCLDLGEWERADRVLAEFGAVSASSLSMGHTASVMGTMAKLSALRGDAHTAFDLVAEIEHSVHAHSGSSYLARAQIVRGIAYLSTGRHLDAWLALSRVFEPKDPSHHFREQLIAVAYLAEAAVRSGHREHAVEVVERMERIAGVWGSPLLAGQLAYARAVLAPDDAAEQLFLQGLASDEAGDPWSRGRLQLAYGRWLRRQQRVTQSRGPLQASLAIFQQLGATRWAEEALDELKASGVQSGIGHDIPAASPLSAQELTIARLAAQGLSNREIGQQLSLSPRTVASHLYRTFPKLGISTRGQIAARLDDEQAAFRGL